MMTAEEAAAATKGLSFEQVWAAIGEVSRHIAEMSKNADQRQLELTQRFNETWGKIEREQEETAKRFKETERYLKRVSRNIGGVNNSLGKWVEKMVSANFWEKFNDLGYVFTKDGPCKFIENNRVVAQVDVFLENEEDAMPVEIKTDLTGEDIDEHVERIGKIRGYMEKRNDKRKLVGAVAGAIV
ncbi:MAG: hypothetical protein LBP76_07440, partial [Treponema sp.]|nr:hypothetical protein [Treponema sp.]